MWFVVHITPSLKATKEPNTRLYMPHRANTQALKYHRNTRHQYRHDGNGIQATLHITSNASTTNQADQRLQDAVTTKTYKKHTNHLTDNTLHSWCKQSRSHRIHNHTRKQPTYNKDYNSHPPNLTHVKVQRNNRDNIPIQHTPLTQYLVSNYRYTIIDLQYKPWLSRLKLQTPKEATPNKHNITPHPKQNNFKIHAKSCNTYRPHLAHKWQKSLSQVTQHSHSSLNKFTTNNATTKPRKAPTNLTSKASWSEPPEATHYTRWQYMSLQQHSTAHSTRKQVRGYTQTFKTTLHKTINQHTRPTLHNLHYWYLQRAKTDCNYHPT
eukprot:gene3210-2192_t